MQKVLKKFNMMNTTHVSTPLTSHFNHSASQSPSTCLILITIIGRQSNKYLGICRAQEIMASCLKNNMEIVASLVLSTQIMH